MTFPSSMEAKEFFITGRVSSRRVFIGTKDREDAHELKPEASQKLRNHSPDGFAWGYGGSGPSQLALAILLDVFNEKIAQRHYQDFKFEIIASFDKDSDFVLPLVKVLEWMKSRASVDALTPDWMECRLTQNL